MRGLVEMGCYSNLPELVAQILRRGRQINVDAALKAMQLEELADHGRSAPFPVVASSCGLSTCRARPERPYLPFDELVRRAGQALAGNAGADNQGDRTKGNLVIVFFTI